MEWLELSTIVDREAVEAVSELLARYAYGSGIVVEEPILPELSGEGYAIDHERPVVVKAYLPLDENAEASKHQIEQSLWHLGWLRGIGQLETKRLAEEDWANAWREHYQVHRVGRRVVIKPSWQPYIARGDDVVVELDPGMAFGTGLHPTTQLCLAYLERLVTPGMRVLDVGTGSGILAIAAAKLGAATVVALDVDTIAVAAARENVARNNLGEAILIQLGSVGVVPDRFDLVVANITARVIAGLAAPLVAAVVPDGRLLIGGIIDEQAATAHSALRKKGMRIVSRRKAGDWLAYVLRSNALDDPAASRSR